jgi:putative redox protein
MDVEAEQTDEHPRVFKDILVTYRLRADAKHELKVRRAIELSLDKYCGVSAMMKKNSAINYKLELLK